MEQRWGRVRQVRAELGTVAAELGTVGAQLFRHSWDRYRDWYGGVRHSWGRVV